MDEMLSQEEINALLKGMDDDDDEPISSISLTADEKDAIGEVSNISMGTAATTLSSLVNNKVTITTPKVEVTTWDKVMSDFDNAFVAIQIEYKDGLDGANLLMLKEPDVKIIADLMMGGDGSNFEGELTELHLSAISEAMNQMIGSAATSMSSLFKKKIDIAPPVSTYIENKAFIEPSELADFASGDFIKVSFSMQIGDLIDSEMMQLYPMKFAKSIYESFSETTKGVNKEEVDTETNKADQNQQGMNQQGMNQQGMNEQGMNQQGMNQQGMNQQGMNQQGMNQQGMNQQGMQGNINQFRNIDVQQAQFQNLSIESIIQQKENINLIMDVPLEVTVELGRTHKSIKDILEFAPGTIIELTKLAGEPIDVLVNGKIVAKGEVVVIDENFGIRITDIIKETNVII
ncbi:MAG: flagellar motor switch phosphatase FliY [Vallitaleaceae bacterium]|jgi:flagellar motor switch protein FliN/FliY|nr:flagellar motor switch phosphatase FliY [Vallitaleaceae bacterium]